MTATVEARAILFAALELHPAIGDGRAHRYVPRQIATPAVWVGDALMFPRTVDGFAELVIQLEVVAVVDGDDTAARQALDELGDAVVDAALGAGFALANRRPSTLDVGGPTLRAVTAFVEYPVHAFTLCPTTPIGATVE